MICLTYIKTGVIVICSPFCADIYVSIAFCHRCCHQKALDTTNAFEILTLHNAYIKRYKQDKGLRTDIRIDRRTGRECLRLFDRSGGGGLPST